MTLTSPERIRLAAQAGCDPRTVSRYIEGSRVHATTRERIERALRSAGRDDLVRDGRGAPSGRALSVIGGGRG